MHLHSDSDENRSNGAASDQDRREAERLAALEHLDAVRPEADHILQEIVDEVRGIFGTDLCMINLILPNVQYFRAWSGEMPEDLAEARQDLRGRSMCQYVVESEEPLVVGDFLATEEFKDQYYYVNYGVRCYAGTPLVTSYGHAVGTLCLANGESMEFSDEQTKLLSAFARAVVARLEALGALRREQDAVALNTQVLERITDAFFALDVEWRFTYINQEAEQLLERPNEQLLGKSLWEEFPEAVGSTFYREYHRAMAEQVKVVFEEYYPPLDTYFGVRAYPSEEGLSIYFQDISGRKRVEEELRLRDSAVTASSNGILITDPPGQSNSLRQPCLRVHDRLRRRRGHRPQLPLLARLR